MSGAVVLRCTGRRVDRNGHPVGPECGNTFTCSIKGYCRDCRNDTAAHHRMLRERARVGGWKCHPNPDGTYNAMCPACGRADPAVIRLCRALEGER